jgi:hypothetical protein
MVHCTSTHLSNAAMLLNLCDLQTDIIIIMLPIKPYLQTDRNK